MKRIEAAGSSAHSTESRELPTTPERRDMISVVLERSGSSIVSELARHSRVSEVTVRKDLEYLELAALGSDTWRRPSPQRQGSDLAFEIREDLNELRKNAIGSAAAALVHDRDSICLDASTTALAVARYLKSRSELTVVTNGIHRCRLAGVPGILS